MFTLYYGIFEDKVKGLVVDLHMIYFCKTIPIICKVSYFIKVREMQKYHNSLLEKIVDSAKTSFFLNHDLNNYLRVDKDHLRIDGVKLMWIL